MSLISIETIAEDVSLGLWKITETADELYQQYPFLETYRDELDRHYRAEARKREFLCVHLLLALMTGNRQLRVEHLSSGKPCLESGQHISISHTKGYAAVILSGKRTVAVDIEYQSDRVQRIAHKFIRPDEEADTILSQLLHWSAKETLYKYFSETPLGYFDMRLQPFVVTDSGTVKGENLTTGEMLPVYYRVAKDYVLTFAF